MATGPSLTAFSYAPDLTFLAKELLLEPTASLSRLCGYGTYTNCSLSQKPLDCSSAVAGPTNTQFRNVFYYNGNGPNSNDWMPVGLFRPILSLLLENSYRIVEALVIDADNGDIGLRNNTVPVELDPGVTGKETLFGSSLRLFVRKTAYVHFAYGSAQVASYFYGVHKEASKIMEPLHLETGRSRTSLGHIRTNSRLNSASRFSCLVE
jgi:hypothetical protein